uniref:DUF1336 domain-containing protein n=1 Tax=Steinernema glaseri TaxID=37863 RepID=A0A1I7ZTT5_9BILA
MSVSLQNIEDMASLVPLVEKHSSRKSLVRLMFNCNGSAESVPRSFFPAVRTFLKESTFKKFHGYMKEENIAQEIAELLADNFNMRAPGLESKYMRLKASSNMMMKLNGPMKAVKKKWPEKLRMEGPEYWRFDEDAFVIQVDMKFHGYLKEEDCAQEIAELLADNFNMCAPKLESKYMRLKASSNMMKKLKGPMKAVKKKWPQKLYMERPEYWLFGEDAFVIQVDMVSLPVIVRTPEVPRLRKRKAP